MTLYFPDNTVLCNFAAPSRLDILEKTLSSRGRWTEAVAHETRRSVRNLPALEAVFRDGWLGDPIEITGIENIRRVDVIRRTVFGGRNQEPLRHLGEAQTLFLLQNDDTVRGSIWVTDDREAGEYARRQAIITRDTVDIVREAVASNVVAAEEAFDVLGRMLAADRHVRRVPPRARDLR